MPQIPLSKYRKQKAIHALLHIARELKTVTFHKAFKILYFAELKHLSRYGSYLFGDWYAAMPDGPVPSRTYDILKALRSELPFPVDVAEEASILRIKNNHFIQPVGEVDYDLFSDSEVECIDESIQENKDLTYGQLKEKSHGPAWSKAGHSISYLDMAAEAGVNEAMLKYIKNNL
jgi:uncharacterized phage-associated protein